MMTFTRLQRSLPRGLVVAGVIVLTVLTATSTPACTLPFLRTDPTLSEVQNTRRLALQIATAVEQAGLAVEGIQLYEISLHDAGKVSDSTHRAFQSRLLVSAKLVRTGLEQVKQATTRPQLKTTLNLLIDDLGAVEKEFAPQFPDLTIGPSFAAVIAGLRLATVFL